jgi:hypothetical protein
MLEAAMNKSLLEENKGRWALFEQVSPASSAILWTIVAAVVVIAAYYVLT